MPLSFYIDGKVAETMDKSEDLPIAYIVLKFSGTIRHQNNRTFFLTFSVTYMENDADGYVGGLKN